MSDAESLALTQANTEVRAEGDGDSHIRSLAKALSWRIVATLTTATIAYFITGELDTAAMIGGIEFVLKFFIYYGHERVWLLVPRGS